MVFLLPVASFITRLGSLAKNFLYDRKVFTPKRALLPAISIGNIAFGGTEKTPMAMELLAWLSARGARPAYISRGYKGNWEHGGGILSLGAGLLGAWEDGGDEPYMVARNFPQAGVFIGKNRLASCGRAKEHGFGMAVLDDAFQHRKLSRDLDIVLFNPSEKTVLRENLSSLKRADILLVRGSQETLPKNVREFSSRREGIFTYTIVTRGFYALNTNGESLPDGVRGKRILAFCGIANPQRFQEQLQKEGAEVVRFVAFPDHFSYPRASLDKLVKTYRESGAEAAVTTEKDAVKIAGNDILQEQIPVFYLKIGLRIEPGFYETLKTLLKNTRWNDQAINT